MKRIASLLLAVVLVLAMLPVTAQAATDPLMDDEDMILDYGASDNDVAAQGVELMGAASEQTYEMENIPKNGTYQTMSTSQKMIDVIKDFEGFRSKAYWDNTQWTVGYGTRAANGNVTVTRAEAEKLLRNALKETYEPIVNNFCKKNGKQPTQQQFDAMLDLTYNAGGSWTSGSAVPDVVLTSSTALDIVKGFGAWSRSGGSVSYVHANRRVREALIYLYGEYYLAYGNQDCKTDLDVVSNDDLPHFKVVIFKTKSGILENGKTDYAGYYPKDDYYRSFITASRDGYTLVGWKLTKVANKSVSGDDRASVWDKADENLELTAVWEKGTFTVAPEEPPADYQDPAQTEKKLPFADVPADSWFYDAVSYVYKNQYMNGIDNVTFDPAGAMTRGMLVTVLYRIDGSVPVSSQERTSFEDIASAYYTDAVVWAYNNGIVNGVSDTRFEPNRIVTRQEAVTIFYRYCMGNAAAAAELAAGLDVYEDRASVAGFAVDAFAWAVNAGVVEGSATGTGVALNPTDNLNRAQAAVLLQRCAEEILK